MPRTILIVDDEQDLVEPLRYALEREGYATIAVSRGDEALAYLDGPSPAPDLVLLDRMLPDMSGLDVCRELRGSGRGRHMRVIVISARTDAIAPDLRSELGIDDFVAKPFVVRELVRRVKAVFGP